MGESLRIGATATARSLGNGLDLRVGLTATPTARDRIDRIRRAGSWLGRLTGDSRRESDR